MMGWKERDWYLGPHATRLFDRNGNAGPTVWSDGRVVGGWGQRARRRGRGRAARAGRRDRRRVVEREAAALTEWLDGTVVTPRFRTPLEQEIAAR